MSRDTASSRSPSPSGPMHRTGLRTPASRSVAAPPRLLPLGPSGVGAAPIGEQAAIVTSGRIAITQGGGGAREPEQREGPVGPALQGPLEGRRRLARPAPLEEDLAQQLGGGLDRPRRAQRRWKLVLQDHRLLHPCHRVPARLASSATASSATFGSPPRAALMPIANSSPVVAKSFDVASSWKSRVSTT